MKRIVLIACLSLIYSNVAFGETPTGGEAFLAEFDFNKNPLKLHFNDGVIDGCMPHPQRVKDAYEGELRRSGFKIFKPDEIGHHYFSISVTGGQISELLTCYYTLTINLSIPTWARDINRTEEHFITPIIWTWGYTGYHPKAGLQKYLEDSARGVVNDLFLKLARAKD